MKKLFFLIIFVLFQPLPLHAEGTLYPVYFQDKNGVEKGSYRVELALSAEDQGRGLMFRSSLPKEQGMLFYYPEKRHITMWMKNTHIPLDMVFVDATRHITHIHRNAVPEDESFITPPNPVNFVIELNGGETARIGLKKGDKLILSQEAYHALFP